MRKFNPAMKAHAKHKCLSVCAERKAVLGLLVPRAATVYYCQPEANETLKRPPFF
jgi:hypothetical protein